jgi:hypothetical protein
LIIVFSLERCSTIIHFPPYSLVAADTNGPTSKGALLSFPLQLSVGMFIIIAIVILIILICIGYCIYQQCFRNRHNSGSGTGGGQGSFDGGSGSSRPTYKEVAKKDEEANMV